MNKTPITSTSCKKSKKNLRMAQMMVSRKVSFLTNCYLDVFLLVDIRVGVGLAR